MSRFTRSVEIDAPAPDVWTTMMDIERWPEWASQFERLEQLDGARLALNSRVRVLPKGLPASVWQVTEFEAGRSFTWESRLSPGIRVTGGHLLTPNPMGTTAQFWLEASGPLGSLLGPILGRLIFSRNTRNATQGLKRQMEEQASATRSAKAADPEV